MSPSPLSPLSPFFLGLIATLGVRNPLQYLEDDIKSGLVTEDDVYRRRVRPHDPALDPANSLTEVAYAQKIQSMSAADIQESRDSFWNDADAIEEFDRFEYTPLPNVASSEMLQWYFPPKKLSKKNHKSINL